jgi:glycine/D-amino acid oxidase-like deaminating enzyme
MRPDVLIVGQGLAGTMLAWELEWAGISFEIADHGHETSATSAAAGIINPITGQRLAKSWKFEKSFPVAQAAYQQVERELGLPLWHPMRVRRIFADERERGVGANPRRRAEFRAFIESADDDGWWIRGAARVDLGSLLAASRARWMLAGKLRVETMEAEPALPNYDLVIDCRGMAGAKSPAFDFVRWEGVRGEVLELKIDGLQPGVILNRRIWITPVGSGTALAGATHNPGVWNRIATPEGRASIETAVREILGPGHPFTVTGQRVGVRINLPLKRPVCGRHPDRPNWGIVNGLGGKGALWAPVLARQWVNHLRSGDSFDPDIGVDRFL